MLDQTRKDVDTWRQKCSETEKNLYEAREVGRQLDRLRNENEHLKIKTVEGDTAKKDIEMMSTKLNSTEERAIRFEDEGQHLKMRNQELEQNLKRTTKSYDEITIQREKDIANLKMLEKENSNYKQ